MSNVNTVISFERLVQDFDSLFRHRVFRLETLDQYDAENEHEPYARFLAGEQADLAWREPWKRLVRETRASGRIMQRVHVVSEPVSDYVRFELLDVYPANVDAGEDVRILGRGDLAIGAAQNFRTDFWLFDDDLVAVLAYDEAGGVQSVQMVSDEQAEAAGIPFMLSFFRDVRDESLRLAIPLAQYVAENNITEKEHAA